MSAEIPTSLRLQLELLGPLLLGANCGFLLGISGPGYVTAVALATLAGTLGLGRAPGAASPASDALPGALLGLGIVLAHAAAGDEEKVAMPSPLVLIIPLSALIGGGFAALGRALLRQR